MTKKVKEFIESVSANLETNLQIAYDNIKGFNDDLNAFCEVYDRDDVLSSTDDNNSTAYPLRGLIFGIKDLFCYAGHGVTAASKILEEYISPFSATVVDRIIKTGGVIIGRNNCDEFGMGDSNENSIYGPVRNLIDPRRTSGGSSGGSAVAVQACMCHVALGTDTGGSVRQPAAFCGVIGFKPSYGHISRYGVIAHSSSFDTVGILARDIDDVMRVYDVISGGDDNDLSMSLREDFIDKKEHYKIGIISNCFDIDCLQKEIRESIFKFCDRLKDKMNVVVNDVKFNFLAPSVPAYYILTSTEACSNLARYDGVRYGYHSVKDDNYDELVTNTRTEGFGWEVKKRILLGNYIFATEKDKNYRKRALYTREKIKEECERLFNDNDFLILPTTSTTAFHVNDKNRDEDASFWGDAFTFLASHAQIPAISIPCGEDCNGLPIGVQILSRRHTDRSLLSFVKGILSGEE